MTEIVRLLLRTLRTAMSAERTYKPGDELVPSYKLLKFLGRGGFGQVWQAIGPGGTQCAIKLIQLRDRMALKEFRAIRLVKLIRHPNLTPILATWLKDESGNLINETSDIDSILLKGKDFELIVAMGLGDKNLLDRLEECRDQQMIGIPSEELLNYIEASAKAIDFLNKGGTGSASHKPIQHCDIKPQNILIVGGEAQVCDFGLARSTEDVRKTSSGAASYCYVAPELISNQTTSATDQYSLAISYYELRTGQLPFQAQSLPQVIQVHLQGTLDLSLVSPEEQRVLKRATANKGEDRWPTCVEMARALRRAVEGGGSGSSSGSSSGNTSVSRMLIGTGPLEPGGEIVPDHKLIRSLGRGGFGEVWEASTGAGGAMKVALKIIRGLNRGHGQQEFRALELMCQEEFSHPHLLEIRNFWLLDDDGMPIRDDMRNQPGAPVAKTLVISMRLAQKSLLQHLKDWQKYSNAKAGITLDELLPFMHQAAEAIDYLNQPHSKDGKEISIQHRDIKPENILLDRNNMIKVADFGLAKVLEGAQGVIGLDSIGHTPNYAAPEFFDSKVTLRSDQYSLAITYFHLRTGHLPFQASNAAEAMMAHKQGKLDFSELPPAEQDILRGATNLDPEYRYPSCLDFIESLIAALNWRPPAGSGIRLRTTTMRSGVASRANINIHGATAPISGGPRTYSDMGGLPTGGLPPMHGLPTGALPSNLSGVDYGFDNDTDPNTAAITQRPPRSDPDFLAHVQQQGRVTGPTSSNPNMALQMTSPLPGQYPGQSNPSHPSMLMQPPKRAIWPWFVLGATLIACAGGVAAVFLKKPNPVVTPPSIDSVEELRTKIKELRDSLANATSITAPSIGAELAKFASNKELEKVENISLKASLYTALAQAYSLQGVGGATQLEQARQVLEEIKPKLPQDSDALKELNVALERYKVSKGLITGPGAGVLDSDRPILDKLNGEYASAEQSLNSRDYQAAARQYEDISKKEDLQKKTFAAFRPLSLLGLARARLYLNEPEKAKAAREAIGPITPEIQKSVNDPELALKVEKASKALDALVVASEKTTPLERLAELTTRLGDEKSIQAAKYDPWEQNKINEMVGEARVRLLADAALAQPDVAAREISAVLRFEPNNEAALDLKAEIDALAQSTPSTNALAELLSLVGGAKTKRRVEMGRRIVDWALADPAQLLAPALAGLSKAVKLLKDQTQTADVTRLMGLEIELAIRSGSLSPEQARERVPDCRDVIRGEKEGYGWVRAVLAEGLLEGKANTWSEASKLIVGASAELKDNSYGKYLQAVLQADPRAQAADLSGAANTVSEIFTDNRGPILANSARTAHGQKILLDFVESLRGVATAPFSEPRFLAGKTVEAARMLEKALALSKGTARPKSIMSNLCLCTLESGQPLTSALRDEVKALLADSKHPYTQDDYRILYLAGEQLKTAPGDGMQLALDCFARLLDLVGEEEIESSPRLRELYAHIVAPGIALDASLGTISEPAVQKKLGLFYATKAKIIEDQPPVGKALFKEKINEELLDAYTKAAAKDPQNGSYVAGRGAAKTRRRPIPSARDDRAGFEAYLNDIKSDAELLQKLEPDHPRAPALLAAIDYLRAALDSQTTDRVGLLQKAEEAYDLSVSLCKKQEKHKHLLTTMLTNRATVLLVFGNFFRVLKQPDKAKEYFEKAANEAKAVRSEKRYNHFLSFSIAAKALEDLDKLDEAVGELRAALRDTKIVDGEQRAEIQGDMGRILYKSALTKQSSLDRKSLTTGISSLEDALKGLPSDSEGIRKRAQAYYYLGRSYDARRNKGDSDLAIAALVSAIQDASEPGLIGDCLECLTSIPLRADGAGSAAKVLSTIREKLPADKIKLADANLAAVVDGRLKELEKKPVEAAEDYRKTISGAQKQDTLSFATLQRALAASICHSDALWTTAESADAAEALEACAKAAQIAEGISLLDAKAVRASSLALAGEAKGKLLDKAGQTPEQKAKLLEEMEGFYNQALAAQPSNPDAYQWRSGLAQRIIVYVNDQRDLKDDQKTALKARAKKQIDQAIQEAPAPAVSQLRNMKSDWGLD